MPEPRQASGPEDTSLSSAVIEVEDSFEAANELAYQRGWTDGLPIVPPTEERVHRMLEHLGRRGTEVVARVGPRKGVATLEKIATNAVMAGCLPEYLPVVVAAVEAIAEPEFNIDGVQSTTSPTAPLVIASGPTVALLGFNAGRNALGHGCRANASIGRALRLVLINIGGGITDVVSKAIMGFPGRYSLCFGENEAGSPWDPLHVERGLPRGSSAVTVVAVQGTTSVNTSNFLRGRDMLQAIASALSDMGHNDILLGGGQPVVVLSPGHAALLAREGFSKQAVKEFLFEASGFPLNALPEDTMRRDRALSSLVGGLVKPVRKAEDFVLVVAGGPEPYHATVLPGFGYSRAVTKAVRLPG